MLFKVLFCVCSVVDVCVVRVCLFVVDVLLIVLFCLCWLSFYWRAFVAFVFGILVGVCCFVLFYVYCVCCVRGVGWCLLVFVCLRMCCYVVCVSFTRLGYVCGLCSV